MNLFGRCCQRFRWGGFGFVRKGKCSEVFGQSNLLDGGAIHGLGKDQGRSRCWGDSQESGFRRVSSEMPGTPREEIKQDWDPLAACIVKSQVETQLWVGWWDCMSFAGRKWQEGRREPRLKPWSPSI